MNKFLSLVTLSLLVACNGDISVNGRGSRIVSSSDFPDGTPSVIPTVDDLSCSASVGGGAFGNSVAVNLSCSAAADIKFCLQEETCCDPESAGTTYSSPIVIGSQDGNFCLSFYGETASSKVSSVIQQSYTINDTYPDLQISFPKINYQTTQLAGLNLLHSSDFSQPNHLIGEINLKSHNPGPNGLNMDCQEIVENYVGLSSPAASVVFDPMDMLGIGSAVQLNVPLMLAKLDYGENFLTSYIVNNSFSSPLYSCSTNKVKLNDFEFFAFEDSHAEVEFAGSFVGYNFFEADADVHRTPAGSASQSDNGQELRVGSFGIYY